MPQNLCIIMFYALFLTHAERRGGRNARCRRVPQNASSIDFQPPVSMCVSQTDRFSLQKLISRSEVVLEALRAVREALVLTAAKSICFQRRRLLFFLF